MIQLSQNHSFNRPVQYDIHTSHHQFHKTLIIIAMVVLDTDVIFLMMYSPGVLARVFCESKNVCFYF